MPPNNLSGVPGAIRSIARRSISVKSTSNQDQENFLIGLQSLLRGKTRLLHSLASNISTDLRSCTRSSTIAAAQSGSQLVNRKTNPSLVRAFSHTIPTFRFDGSFFSSTAYCPVDAASDVLFDTSVSTEMHSSSENSELCLRLNSASCYLPHPEKEETGGEDAHFICANGRAIGVADGVGGWADHGIDSGNYARELMSNSVSAIDEEPNGSIDPATVLAKAYTTTNAKGSSTACIIALTDKGLHAINLGDSGFMVVREGCTVFRSRAQQHDFNHPYQLESGNTCDLPSSGQVFTVRVASGDVIIAGTDGLFDNLYHSDITAIVVHAVRAHLGPEVTARQIAELARQRAEDANRQTPFSSAAQDAGFRYRGGKLDDITVVVSYVTDDAPARS